MHCPVVSLFCFRFKKLSSDPPQNSEYCQNWQIASPNRKSTSKTLITPPSGLFPPRTCRLKRSQHELPACSLYCVKPPGMNAGAEYRRNCGNSSLSEAPHVACEAGSPRPKAQAVHILLPDALEGGLGLLPLDLIVLVLAPGQFYPLHSVIGH